ncbi:DNA polymerase IV [Anaerosphaera multitolerans]|uniref:DNA polymerase IV n=1 Tax=Anaerosphaera multitolerans TaxID=2487351 RepID=A0A437S5S0_9FIRM|nr:DNA polymerase IV [Anaerosphaera multitolerans]RVU54317.1 DNA polymerase IV [Anaerosphaera multitolerans]
MRSKRNNIIHVDIDAFYASVEELDNPALIGKPMCVGGLSERSIITTANYEARKYGIHSAMPVFMAKQLCSDLIIVPMRRARYVEKSKEVFNIIQKYSDIVEKVSIDEAYIDITGKKAEPVDIIYSLKKDIKDSTGLTISAGLSYNKFLAKLASDWNKPNGMMIITKSDIPDILMPLDINKVHGLGKKSQEKLRDIGINTIEELLSLSEEFLFEMFGKMGIEVYHRIRGIDKRKVEPDRVRKSMGVERTFLDTNDTNTLTEYIKNFSKELSEDLKAKNLGFNTITLKLKKSNFKTTTHSKTFTYTIKDFEEIYDISMKIFNEEYTGEKLRLVGISASNLVDLNFEQLSFYNLKKS